MSGDSSSFAKLRSGTRKSTVGILSSSSWPVLKRPWDPGRGPVFVQARRDLWIWVYSDGTLVRGMGMGEATPSDETLTRPASFDDFFAVEVTGQVRRATVLLGSIEEANDVVQEAFVRLYQRWATVEAPGPYLNRIVLNLCRDHGRRAISQRSLRQRLVAVSDPPADREVLSDVLAELPFNHRAAIVLRFWGGLTTREIAEQLDCPTGSVGPWIDRGLEAIRKVIA